MAATDSTENAAPRKPIYKRLASRDLLITVCIFCIVFVTHVSSKVIASGDSRWVVPAAKSLIDEGNVNLDEYPDSYRNDPFTLMEQHDGHWYNGFPVGMTLLATPFVYILDRGSQILFHLWPGIEQRLIARAGEPIEHITVLTVYWRVELLIATFFMALSAVLLYVSAREELEWPHALIVVFLFAFCTAAWSTGSRSLGQQTGSILMLSATLSLLLCARRKPWVVQFAALPLAFSYIVRPTNSLCIAFLTLYIAIKYVKYVPAYTFWALLVAAPWLVFNWSVYHRALPPYFRPGYQHLTLPTAEALAGLLISPSRGLLIFMPIALLGVVGVVIRMRRHDAILLNLCVMAIILAQWFTIAGFAKWWGGHSYGPRYFADIVPLFMYLLFPVVGELRRPINSPRALLAAVAAILTVWSFYVNCRGATDLQTWAWNREPIDVDFHTERLWDWTDPQFLRGLHW